MPGKKRYTRRNGPIQGLCLHAFVFTAGASCPRVPPVGLLCHLGVACVFGPLSVKWPHPQVSKDLAMSEIFLSG